VTRQTTQPEPTAQELQRQKEEDKKVADAIKNLSEQQKALLTEQGSSVNEKRGK